MAVQVYSIDQTYVENFYPQVDIATSAVVTPTTIVQIIESSASRVNGILLAHGLDPDDINAAVSTNPETYTIVRGLVIVCLKPIFDRILLAPDETIAASELLCVEQLTAVQRLPQILGTSSDDLSPSVRTSTQYLDIEISTVNREKRRRYGAGWRGF